jgi:DNA-binding FadR family transcriptional regulator
VAGAGRVRAADASCLVDALRAGDADAAAKQVRRHTVFVDEVLSTATSDN